MMDVESGKCNAGGSDPGLPKILAAASAFVSCLAMAGVFLLLLQNHSLQTKMESLQQFPQAAAVRAAQDDAQKEIARREVSM